MCVCNIDESYLSDFPSFWYLSILASLLFDPFFFENLVLEVTSSSVSRWMSFCAIVTSFLMRSEIM